MTATVWSLDAGLLLEFVRRAKDETGSYVAEAIYAGREARILRGDFDTHQDAA